MTRDERRVPEDAVGHVGERYDQGIDDDGVGGDEPEEQTLAEVRLDAARLHRERHHTVEQVPVADVVQRRDEDARELAPLPHLAGAQTDGAEWSDEDVEHAHVHDHQQGQLSTRQHRQCVFTASC